MLVNHFNSSSMATKEWGNLWGEVKQNVIAAIGDLLVGNEHIFKGCFMKALFKRPVAGEIAVRQEAGISETPEEIVQLLCPICAARVYLKRLAAFERFLSKPTHKGVSACVASVRQNVKINLCHLLVSIHLVEDVLHQHANRFTCRAFFRTTVPCNTGDIQVCPAVGFGEV